MESRDIVYRVGPDDSIVAVNRAWEEFAQANGADLSGAAVVGRPLWDHIADPTSRALYRRIVERVRAGGKARFALRCDAPNLRRTFEMTVVRTADGLVEFRSRPVESAPRRPLPLLEPRVRRSQESLLMCSWCHRIAVHDGWAEVEDAVSVLRAFEREPLPRLTHGICPSCLVRIEDSLENG